MTLVSKLFFSEVVRPRIIRQGDIARCFSLRPRDIVILQVGESCTRCNQQLLGFAHEKDH
jgi:hypothetical protein